MTIPQNLSAMPHDVPIHSAVIISAGSVSPQERSYLSAGAFVVACDAGYRNAERLGVRPDLLIGDFDSAPQPADRPDAVVLPHVKDDSDTHYAARWLLEHHVKQVCMLGALGGFRIEHTLANIATALFLAENGVEVLMADARSELRVLLPHKLQTLKSLAPDGSPWAYLSVFPLKGKLAGVQMQGVYYPLENALLTADRPLGVSNEFIAPQATVSCTEGAGLIVVTRADTNNF